MKTFKEYMINEGKLSKTVSGALVGLSLLGATPDIKGKDIKPSQQMIINKQGISKLYRAIEKAETGSFSNHWIRTTHAPPKGSSAYGPVQITGTLVRDLKNRYHKFANEHKDYIEKFLSQSDLFIKYGKEPNKKGYDKKYEYGGSGDLTSKDDRVAYMKMALGAIEILLKEQKYDLKKFIKRWRGKSQSEDKRYFDVITKHLQK